MRGAEGEVGKVVGVSKLRYDSNSRLELEGEVHTSNRRVIENENCAVKVSKEKNYTGCLCGTVSSSREGKIED